MRRVYYAVPDTAVGAVRRALSEAPHFPSPRAHVRIDTTANVVVIETAEPWRSDAHGMEVGLGVPGWALLATEEDDTGVPDGESTIGAVRGRLSTLPVLS